MTTINYAEQCACGLPLHYTNSEHEAKVRLFVTMLGPLVKVKTHEGTWNVPRHYIALHGITAQTLAAVAAQYGFEKLA